MCKQTVAALTDFLSVSSEPCSFFIKSYDSSENQRNSCQVFSLKCRGALGRISIFEKNNVCSL